MDAAIGNGDHAALDQNRKGAIRDALMLLLMSTLLYQLGLSVFIFVSPLMIYAVKYGKGKAALLIAAELLVISALELIKGGIPNISNVQSLIGFALSIYFPLSLSAAGIVWLYASDKKVVTRLILSVLPSVVLGVIYAVPFVVDRALFSETYVLYEDAFVTLVGPMMDPIVGEFDWSTMFYIVLISGLSVVLPLMLVAVCASCFIYETAEHSKESRWEERVKRFAIHSDVIWLLIVSWALVLLNRFISAPAYVPIILLNVALFSVVLYAAQGFSVMYAILSRKKPRLKSMHLFLILAILAIAIPGLNIIVIFSLPLLGILESFFDLKKIGVKNEDYS